MNKEEAIIYKNNYTIVPSDILHNNNLSASEKLLYGDIIMLCNEEGYFWTTTDYLANFCRTSKTTISQWISNLEKENYIKLYKVSQEEIVNKLKNKNLKNKGIGDKICEWCKIRTVVLHTHHYPLSKKDKGTTVVKICPNCHHEFHFFNKFKIELVNKKLVKEKNNILNNYLEKLNKIQSLYH